MQSVDVNVPSGAYPLYISAGGVGQLGPLLARHRSPGRVFVVTNPVVGALYLADTLASLEAAGFAPVAVEIPDGERHKTLDTWRALVERLVALRIDRSTPVVALGGGVTGDIAGFAAATAMRGVPLVQVPTTLLAMVDSAVGGKTGVNTAHGKNLVGAFHQPGLVFAPLAVLSTLPVAEVRAGMAEVVKHAILGDTDLWGILEARGAAIVAGDDPSGMAACVAHSAALKARIVSEDERETGVRALLNYGHTVGHAIEAVAKGGMRHGECVALGMLAELRHSEAVGRSTPGLAARLQTLLQQLGLPCITPSGLSRSEMVDAAAHDKKRIRGTVRVPVVHHIGAAACIAVPPAEVAEMISHLDATVPRGELDRTVAVSENS